MQSFLFALNAVLPIIITVFIGYILKRIGLITQEFAKMANKLVFRVFLPAMLFLNVYKIEDISGVDFGYVLYSMATVIAIFFIMIPTTSLVTKRGDRRGALLQSSFRSNYALIGIPLATSLYGELGGAVASVLSAVIIPVFNMLAVISLSVFRKSDSGKGGFYSSVKRIFLGIVKNPLIISVFAGCVTLLIRMAFAKWGIAFRLSQVTPIYSVLGYLSSVATPLALIILGAQFEFSAISELKREIIFGTLVRCAVVPLIGLGVAYIFFRDLFSGMHFAAFVAVFATPVAVSSVPMAQEMDADVGLAGQLVVWTTLFSAVGIFLSSFILSLLGVFG